ncbi:Protein strawberry notch [Orchesella cincta]|uniref:Protein strawberry notch n=1 Tax=Orchesella cincta TaxID=48709 RepID=A0A1D2MTD0_ORCCI|nr:Protein strawberry notch [Orchesella cincta]
MTWEESQERYSSLRGRYEGYYISDNELNPGNKLCLLAISESSDPDTDRDYDYYTVLKPFCGVQQKSEKLETIFGNMHKVAPEVAKKYWINQYEKSSSMCFHRFRFLGSNCHLKGGKRCDVGLRKLSYYVISGNVLLVWEKIEDHLIFTSTSEGRKDHVMKIVRAQTDSGFTAIGLLVPGNGIEKLVTEMEKLGSDAPKIADGSSAAGAGGRSNDNNNTTTALVPSEVD